MDWLKLAGAKKVHPFERAYGFSRPYLRSVAKVFDALDWLAAMTSHVPNKGEQMVRYYGHYSNASRGLRQKKNLDDLIPSILEPEDLKPNRTWA